MSHLVFILCVVIVTLPYRLQCCTVAGIYELICYSHNQQTSKQTKTSSQIFY